VHVVQLELSQQTYMEEEPPFRFDETRANRIRTVLRELVGVMLDWGGHR
jgi:N-formylglutamate deformylase